MFSRSQDLIKIACVNLSTLDLVLQRHQHIFGSLWKQKYNIKLSSSNLDQKYCTRMRYRQKKTSTNDRRVVYLNTILHEPTIYIYYNILHIITLKCCFYRSGTVNSNTVNSKFHLIRSFLEIFAKFLSFHV